jgi:FkbM family methyltransferase
MTDYEQRRIDKLIAKNMIYEARITQQDEQIAKLTRLLAEACEEIFLLSNMHLNHALENCSEELQQWYEERKKQDEERKIDNNIIAENKYKQKIEINPSDHIGSNILSHGIYDSKGVQCIEKILSRLQSPIVFDIGANIGNHALVMARYSKMVYLFEPQRNTVLMLHNTMMLNSIKNWKIFEFGLSDEQKILPLYQNLDGNNGASTFISQLKGDKFAVEQLQVKKGDDIVRESNINQLDFIKIDVEGFEAKAISGLADSIKRFSPIILMEWNNIITKQQFKELNLFNNVFDGYITKAIISNHHKSLWQNKKLGKIRRFFYKRLTKKRTLLSSFSEYFDYPHVLLIPKHKAHLVDITAA